MNIILHERSERSKRSEVKRYQKQAKKNFARPYMDGGDLSVCLSVKM